MTKLDDWFAKVDRILAGDPPEPNKLELCWRWYCKQYVPAGDPTGLCGDCCAYLSGTTDEDPAGVKTYVDMRRPDRGRPLHRQEYPTS